MMMSATEQELSLAPLRQHNDDSIIFHLPVEIICEITLLVSYQFRSAYHDFFDETTRKSQESDLKPKSWNCFQAGHLCHRWRTIAIEFPLLWTEIFFQLCDDAITELLLRSKDSPLCAYTYILPGNPPCAPSTMRILQSELHRIHTIHGTGLHSLSQEFFDTLSHTPAPILEYLRLYADSAFPPTLFNGHSPHLRTLVLFYSREIDCRSEIFSNLVHLHLNLSSFVSDQREFHAIDMLTTMAPTIEDIRFYSVVFLSGDEHPPIPTKRVALPKLSEFSHLLINARAAAAFVSLIELDHPITLTLDVRINDTLELAGILAWISIYAASQLADCMLIKTSIDPYYCQIQLEFNSSGPPVMLKVKFELDDLWYHEIQEFIFNSLPLSHIKSVSFDYIPSVSLGLQAYSRISGAEEFCLTDSGSVDDFFHALKTNISLNQDDVPEILGDLFMPQLRVIVVYGIDFDEKMPDERACHELVLESLKSRKMAGFPVERLEIRSSKHVADGILLLLGDNVGSVIWDKVVVADPVSSGDGEQ